MFHSLTRRGAALWLAATLTLSSVEVTGTSEPSKRALHPAPAGGEPHMKITVRSTAFDPGGPIPRKHTGDGEDLSPPLAWSDMPKQAKELALIVDDPDAPSAEPWVHWVIYKIPLTLRALPQGISPAAKVESPGGALQGKNSWGTVGWRGPSPPRGDAHHYHFKLYALDVALQAQPGLDKRALLAAIKGHVVAEGELVGTYQR